MVNHLYIYCVDRDFGRLFLEFSTYFPFSAKLCPNGHEYAKRQLVRSGSDLRPWTTVFCVAAIPGVHRPCDGLSAEKIEALLRKWLRFLPHPYTVGDRKAGYRYQISILQAELSLIHVGDPAQGEPMLS